MSLVGYTLILEAYRRAPGELRGGGAPGERALRGRDRRALAAASGRARARVLGALATVAGVALIALFP